MNCLFGLGNPGKEYDRTRHNIGFALVEKMAVILHAPAFSQQSKFTAELTQTRDWALVKPQTYMNDSGRTVKSFVSYYHKDWFQTADFSHIFVAHDDLDLELGHFKIQKGTGPKVHNGLNSIYDHLHSKDFWHLRLGVDNRHGDRSLPGHQYVLGSFSAEEQKQVDEMLTTVIAQLQHQTLQK